MELKLNDKYMLTIKEAAAYYGIGMKFLRRCAENEEGKFSVICGNRVMIIKTRFEEYLHACSESGLELSNEEGKETFKEYLPNQLCSYQKATC